MNIRNNNEKENIIVTGSAGFIGYHLSKSLLEDGFNVIGIDSLNNYYDLSLKNKRNDLLKSFNNYNYELHLEDYGRLTNIFEKYSPKYIFHLAAQAGVRYSIENPREYLSSNIIGTYNLLEISSLLNLIISFWLPLLRFMVQIRYCLLMKVKRQMNKCHFMLLQRSHAK